VRNRRLPEFRRHFGRLPRDVQRAADAAFAQFASDPNYPGLDFKALQTVGDVWSVKIGLHYRAVAFRNGELLTWFWIGTHAEYDQLLKRL
jgi:hypothetical protein